MSEIHDVSIRVIALVASVMMFVRMS